jgi:hypothetical protein
LPVPPAAARRVAKGLGSIGQCSPTFA